MFLDSGTTVEAVARRARRASRTACALSVLTNSLGVATALADVPGIDCVLLGGQLRRVDGSVVGDLALENLQRFTFSAASSASAASRSSGSAWAASPRRRSRRR